MTALALVSSDLRAEVMAQPPEERLDYALGFLDLVCPPPCTWARTAANLGLDGLRPQVARILHRLAVSQGQIVPFDALEAAAEFEGLSGDRNALKVSVSRLRCGIRAAGLPIIIETYRGVGYRLEAAAELPMPRRRA
jgi:hypothetical protein